VLPVTVARVTVHECPGTGISGMMRPPDGPAAAAGGRSGWRPMAAAGRRRAREP
jgi:hypothetical protein